MFNNTSDNNNDDDDDDEFTSIYGLFPKNNNNDDEIDSVYGLSLNYKTKNGHQIDDEKNPFRNIISISNKDNNNNMLKFFELIMQKIKISISIKHVIPNHNNERTLKDKFETEGFKQTLQSWSTRANTKTQHMLVILFCIFNNWLFTDCNDYDCNDFASFKQSLTNKLGKNLEWLPWNDNVWNLMTSPESGMSLFHIIPQSTTLQFYSKAFDFLLLAFITIPQINSQLWVQFWQKANNNNWCNIGSIFEELSPNFKDQICKNANKCNYYLGIFLYIYIFLYSSKTPIFTYS